MHHQILISGVASKVPTVGGHGGAVYLALDNHLDFFLQANLYIGV